MRLNLFTVAAGLTFAVLPTAAHADQFTISGAQSISFSLPASPVPSTFAVSRGFTVDNVNMTVNGSAQTESLIFFEDGIAIGSQVSIGEMNGMLNLNVSNPLLIAFSTIPGVPLPNSDPLYTHGTEANPTFNLGTYALEDPRTQTITSTLTIAPDPIVAATPEPSSFALLGTGLLGLAGAVRRRLA